MKKFYDLLCNNAIGVIVGNFRSKLSFSEFQRFFQTGSEIIFEKDNGILGVLKPSDKVKLSLTSQGPAGKIGGEQVLLSCSFEHSGKPKTAELLLTFDSSCNTGHFTAVIHGYESATEKLK